MNRLPSFSTTVQPFYPHSSPFVLFLLYYMRGICLYVYTNSFSYLLILWCIYFYVCCTCWDVFGWALTVNLFCLSRKLFLTAVIPDGFLSIFLQLLKKWCFLKPYEFYLRVLHNSMYSNISFPSTFWFPSCFSFC